VFREGTAGCFGMVVAMIHVCNMQTLYNNEIRRGNSFGSSLGRLITLRLL
jgi:hypothetical protein